MKYSDEFHSGSVFGALIGLLMKVTWWSLVYSPFVFVGGYVFFVLWEKFSFHGLVSVVGGIISAIALYFLIFFFEGIRVEMKLKGQRIWILLKMINLLIVCGLPFFIGGSLATSLAGSKDLRTVEFWVIFVFFGFFLSLVAYFGVFGQASAQENKNET